MYVLQKAREQEREDKERIERQRQLREEMYSMSTTAHVLEEQKQQALQNILMASGALYQQRGQLGEQAVEKRNLYAELKHTLGAKGDLMAEVSNVESGKVAALRGEMLAEQTAVLTREEAFAGIQSVYHQAQAQVGTTRNEAEQALGEQRRTLLEEARREKEQPEVEKRMQVHTAEKHAYQAIIEAKRETEALRVTAEQHEYNARAAVQLAQAERAAERDRSLNEEATQRSLYAIAEEKSFEANGGRESVVCGSIGSSDHACRRQGDRRVAGRREAK